MHCVLFLTCGEKTRIVKIVKISAKKVVVDEKSDSRNSQQIVER